MYKDQEPQMKAEELVRVYDSQDNFDDAAKKVVPDGN